MKTTQTTHQFFPVIRGCLTALQLDVESRPPDWHKSLQAAINQGAFIKLEFGHGLAGVVDCRLLLVSQKGETITISTAGGNHV